MCKIHTNLIQTITEVIIGLINYVNYWSNFLSNHAIDTVDTYGTHTNLLQKSYKPHTEFIQTMSTDSKIYRLEVRKFHSFV